MNAFRLHLDRDNWNPGARPLEILPCPFGPGSKSLLICANLIFEVKFAQIRLLCGFSDNQM